MPTNLNMLASEIHQQCVEAGWWDAYNPKSLRHETAMFLTITEWAEACEGDRKDLMDDKLPQHAMFKVEIADALIRSLDLAGSREVNLSSAEASAMWLSDQWKDRPFPAQLMGAVRYVCRQNTLDDEAIACVAACLALARVNRFDVYPIVKAKRDYNSVRPDHKKEAREAEGGKRY